ncbi:receptor like protein 11 [Raphanus sativus]|uniref:Receptor-like protein 11 n=1 Tax=Raphanus sativus TaxID=3726 RepID=A0A6J0LLQ4_RAPSA|nr:receptor-like protein 11 [Raphanus sativus]KAJ4909499.1 receptor like protein 11 [Raphanus sativus]
MIQNHCYCFSGIIITIYCCLLIHALASPALHFCRHDQRKALLEFIDEFPTNEFNASLWNKSSDCCFWEGVKCDYDRYGQVISSDTYGQVMSLDLSEVFLNGPLKTNSSLFRLHYLSYPKLSLCDLQGEIPSSLGNLSRLTFVNLSGNNLIGEIPASIGYLNNLSELSFEDNNLTGEIPSWIGNLSSLTNINLGSNELCGTLYHHHKPIVFQSLIALDLSGNRIYGNIPVSIGFLKKLSLLNLSHNAFTDVIPRSLADLTNLETLDLSSNMLSGEIPQYLTSLSSISYMNFSHNRLTGPVPRGTQFQSQNCSSFMDNPGLYDLQEICGELHVPEPTSQQHEEKIFNWVAAAIAYGPGVFFGFVVGYVFTSDKQEWFTERFGRRKLRVTRIAR